jgi:hypothetical protein
VRTKGASGPGGGYDYHRIVSLVLFRTSGAEVDRAVSQILGSKISVHVVVVDNTQPPVPLPAYDPARVTVIRNASNLGYGSAHNRAIEASRGKAPYHLAMNTDLVMHDDVIASLYRFMEGHPEAGLVMPKVYYPDGRTQYLCRLLPHPIDMLVRGLGRRSRWAARRNRRYESRGWSHDSVRSFPFLSGCFMMFRSSILAQVGGFDERFFLYGEDIDISRRVHALAQTLFVPSARITHEYRSEAAGPRKQLQKLVNISRYFNKWGWFIDRSRDSINARAVHGRWERDPSLASRESAA